MAYFVTVSKCSLLFNAILAVAFLALPAVSQVIQISNYADLCKIGADTVNFPLNGSYELTANIDASQSKTANAGAGFMPIGTSDKPFKGTFDGKGHTISGLFINRPALPTGRNVGLFGVVDSASISNVTVEADSVAGVIMVGILAGRAENSNFNGCTTAGKVSSSAGTVGGLIGNSYNSVITGSSSSGTVYISTERVGGLIGFASGGEINACYSSSNIDIDRGAVQIGGLIGYSEVQIITDSYSTGYIKAAYATQAGGLIGYSSSTVTGSYSSVALDAGNIVGGLIGKNHGTVTGSYYENRTGSVKGRSDVGGLIGANEGGAVVGSRARTSVFGDSAVGGLIGGNYKGTVDRCRYETDIDTTIFNLGEGVIHIDVKVSDTVSGTGSRTGGLIGSNHGAVRRSHAAGFVLGRFNVGGLTGWNEDSLSMCYSAGYVNYVLFGNAVGESVGGLAGTNAGGVIIQCYSVSSVNGTSYVGGLVGNHDPAINERRGSITESYSAGPVNGSYSIGGLVGIAPLLQASSTIVRSCWDTQASGLTVSAGGEGMITEIMQNSYFGTGDLGWDFVNVWQRVPNGYPQFIYQSEIVSVFRGRQHRGSLTAAPVPKVVIRGKMLSIAAPEGINYRVRLIDMRGRVVTGFSVNGSASFPLSKISAGRYLVETRLNGKIISVSPHNI
ncbi:MAG: hypothetical protein FWB94_02120 [Chitinispirillia bacterium]|nr:hypothetical protein [Chitinispirillia bacterium]